MGGFLFGFDSSVMNGAVDAMQTHYALNEWMKGFAVAIALLGCAVGAWFAGQLADLWGRKTVMVLGSIMFIIGSIGTGLAFAVWDLLLFRVIGGLGIGIASVIAPAYISEIAPARFRGALGSLQQLAITAGIFIALLSDDQLQSSAGGAANHLWGLEAWRWMFIVGVVPAVIYGLLAITIPESPRFLVGHNQEALAARVLRRVTGVADPQAKVDEIRGSLHTEAKRSIRDLRGPTFGLQPVVWVGIAIAIFQQFVGINVIFYYSTTLWKSVGFSDKSSFQTSVITGLVNFVMTFVAILFVDKVGRRKLLMIGSVGMCIGLALAAIAFTQQSGSGKDVTLPDSWGVVALIGANLFVVAFAAKWGPVMWVMLGEMFPNHIRGYALGISTAANWLANFAITLLFPEVNRVLGLTWIYGFFAVCAALSGIYVHRAVRETTGVELENMGDESVRAVSTSGKAL